MAFDAGAVLVRMEADLKAIRQMVKGLDKVKKKTREVKKEVKDADNAFAKWAKQVGRVVVSFTLAYRAMNLLEDGIKSLVATLVKSVRSIDDYKLSSIEMAASLISFAEISGEDVPRMMTEAIKMFDKMQLKLELLAAQTILTTEELRLLYGAGLKTAVFPFTSKDLQNLTVIGTAIKVMTKDQKASIQMIQEFMSLMQGGIRQSDRFGKMLKAMHPDIAKSVQKWREMGRTQEGNLVILEEFIKLLKGYEGILGRTSKLLVTQLGHFESAVLAVGRKGMLGAYEDIVALLSDMADSLVNQNGLTERGEEIASSLRVAWEAVAGAVKMMYKWIKISFDFLEKQPAIQSLKLMYNTIQAIREVMEAIKKIEQDSVIFGPGPPRARLKIPPAEDEVDWLGLKLGGEKLIDEKAYNEWLKTLKAVARIKARLARETAKSRREFEFGIPIGEPDTDLMSEIYDKRLQANREWRLRDEELNDRAIVADEDRLRRHNEAMLQIERDYYAWRSDYLSKDLEARIRLYEYYYERLGRAIEWALEDSLVAGMRGELEEFEDIAKRFIRMLQQIQAEIIISGIKDKMGIGARQSLGNWMMNLSGPYSRGGAANYNMPVDYEARAYQHGGIVTKPTLGLIGEAGPEAIIPLDQVGGFGSNVVVNISAVDAQSFAELTSRNPQAIIGPIVTAIERGDRGLRNSIRGA